MSPTATGVDSNTFCGDEDEIFGSEENGKQNGTFDRFLDEDELEGQTTPTMMTTGGGLALRLHVAVAVVPGGDQLVHDGLDGLGELSAAVPANQAPFRLSSTAAIVPIAIIS